MKQSAEAQIDAVRLMRGPFVVAVETTRMPMIFTDASVEANPVVYANDSFLAITGYTRRQIAGKPVKEILGGIMLPGSSNWVEDALASGQSGIGVMPCRRIDGTEFQADVALSPVHDTAGLLTQNFLSVMPVGTGYDRTVKRPSEAFALYESAPGFIATAEGPEHRFTFANASYRKFVGRSALEGRTVAEALPEIVTQGFIDILDRVYRTGVPYRGTNVPFDIDDGQTGTLTRRYGDFVYQPVRDERGAIVGLFCEGYDVTAQREATDSLALVQSELIHLSRVNAMGTMVVTLAHELNQPLSAITNYTAGAKRLVASAAEPDEPILRALDAIAEASLRASDIIRTLRELVKRRVGDPEPFDLKSAIGECIRLVGATISPNTELIDLTPPGLVISADRIQIQQVVINLLRNACDAVAGSSQMDVTLTAKTVGDSVIVCIADAGPGLSVEAAENIFSWTESTKEGGMGLGLSICRTIVEGHRGRIWVERSNSAGSELCFSIPVQLAESRPATEGSLLGTAD
jgi:two-component system, LuxR family, sensor kinase FixL